MYPQYNQFGGFGMQQPYQQMQAYQPPQLQQQIQRQSFLIGRIVNNVDEITVQEVPTDGSFGWFPSADGSCVYAKYYMANGTIATKVFTLENAVTDQADPVSVMMGKIDQILAIVKPEEVQNA